MVNELDVWVTWLRFSRKASVVYWQPNYKARATHYQAFDKKDKEMISLYCLGPDGNLIFVAI